MKEGFQSHHWPPRQSSVWMFTWWFVQDSHCCTVSLHLKAHTGARSSIQRATVETKCHHREISSWEGEAAFSVAQVCHIGHGPRHVMIRPLYAVCSLFPGCCTHQIQAQCSTHLGVGTRHLDCFHINIIPLLVVGGRHARDIEGPEIRQGKGRDIFPFLPEFLVSTFQPRYLADVRSKGRRNASRAMSTVFRSVQG